MLPVVDAADRAEVEVWLQAAEDWVESGQGQLSWLTSTIMLEMALGYAVNSGNKTPPLVYSLLIRVGYALRVGVSEYATPQPLDVSTIDKAAVNRLASLPRDAELGTLVSDDSDEQEALMAPIVALASETAESSSEFVSVLSVDPAFWNTVVSMATRGLQVVFQRNGYIRRAHDLDPVVAESFLRYGYVLRCLDESLQIDGTAEAR
jgi:hypothetical protein